MTGRPVSEVVCMKQRNVAMPSTRLNAMNVCFLCTPGVEATRLGRTLLEPKEPAEVSSTYEMGP